MSDMDPNRDEIKRLREWRDNVSNAIKCAPEFEPGEWAGDKEGWGYHFEIVQFLHRDRAALQARQQELLATIVKVSNTTPFADEAKDALEQRGKLVAEIGTLRSQLAAEVAANERHAERNRKALDLLNIKYPGLCNEHVWGGGIVEGIEDLQRKLAAMTAARDEACAIGRRHTDAWSDPVDFPRLDELRKVGELP